MSQAKLHQMADILLPINSDPLVPLWLQILIGAGLLGIIILLIIALWRYFIDPLNTLVRQIKQKKLSCRASAHELARVIKSETGSRAIQDQLTRLRFQRHQPQANELLNLIRQLRHGQ